MVLAALVDDSDVAISLSLVVGNTG